MATVQSYEIILKNKTGEATKTSATDEATEQQDFIGSAYSAVKKFEHFAPVAGVLAISKDIFSWQMSLVGRNTGDTLTQSKINKGMSMATHGLATVGVLVGAVATNNPLLAVGAVTDMVMTGLNYAKEQEQLNYEKEWESIGLLRTRERAGSSLNRSRLS